MSLSTSGLSLADSNPVPPRSLVSCVKCSTEINCAANETFVALQTSLNRRSTAKSVARLEPAEIGCSASWLLRNSWNRGTKSSNLVRHQCRRIAQGKSRKSGLKPMTAAINSSESEGDRESDAAIQAQAGNLKARKRRDETGNSAPELGGMTESRVVTPFCSSGWEAGSKIERTLTATDATSAGECCMSSATRSCHMHICSKVDHEQDSSRKSDRRSMLAPRGPWGGMKRTSSPREISDNRAFRLTLSIMLTTSCTICGKPANSTAKFEYTNGKSRKKASMSASRQAADSVTNNSVREMDKVALSAVISSRTGGRDWPVC
eukprot:m.805795 g.805795  ORF g.805795 m.805795 type:complete len:320 (+) comp59291_c0_seq9:206-1165(+)